MLALCVRLCLNVCAQGGRFTLHLCRASSVISKQVGGIWAKSVGAEG